ncbi:DUF4352 domain-containing protein [Candidatus Saccharibacteria bacterium]|nr:DUF4352 domain-containing protein [Candidatus Saccharibacteria bacterium]
MATKATNNNSKTPIYKKWWFWVIVIIFVGSIGVGMRGGSEHISDVSNQAKENNSSNNQTENKPFVIGDTVEVDGQKVTVDSISRNYVSELVEPDSGQEFVQIAVTIENNSNETISYNVMNWKIETSEGDVRGWEGMAQGDNALNSGELTSGGKKTGTIVFEVPQDDTGLKVHYKPDYWGKKEVVIELHD